MEEQGFLCFTDRCLYCIKRILMVQVFVFPSVLQICFAKVILFFNLPLFFFFATSPPVPIQGLLLIVLLLASHAL